MAEVARKVNLDGEDTDPTREALVEQMLSVIAADAPNEMRHTVVNILSEIHSCKLSTGEWASDYTRKFNRAVASYVNYTKILSNVAVC